MLESVPEGTLSIRDEGNNRSTLSLSEYRLQAGSYMTNAFSIFQCRFLKDTDFPHGEVCENGGGKADAARCILTCDCVRLPM